MSIAEKFETIADAVYEKGYSDGCETVSLAHWNAITLNGTREKWNGKDGYSPFMVTDYSNIKFPKPILITGDATRLFRSYKGEYLPRKEDIDMTGVTSAAEMFSYIYGNGCKTIPDYGIPALGGYYQTYAFAQDVYTIELIRCNENTTFNAAFTSCSNLKNVTFEGIIGKSINLSWSPLSVESMKNVIAHLKDYSEDADSIGKNTLAFSDDSWESLEASGAAPDGDTWENYVIKLGWLIG